MNDLKEKNTAELLDLFEKSKDKAIRNNIAFEIKKAGIEGQLILRTAEMSPDEFLQYKFIREKKIYTEENNQDLDIDPFTGHPYRKVIITKFIFKNINNLQYEMLQNEIYNNKIIKTFPYYKDKKYLYNDTKYQKNKMFSYFEEIGEIKKELETKEKYIDAIERNTTILKGFRKSLLDSEIEKIIKEYEKDGKDVFDSFENIYTFVSNWISKNQTEETHNTERIHHSECLKTVKNNHSKATDKISRRLTDISTFEELGAHIGHKVATNGARIFSNLRVQEGAYIKLEDLRSFDTNVACAIQSCFDEIIKKNQDNNLKPVFTLENIATNLIPTPRVRANKELLKGIHESIVRQRLIEVDINAKEIENQFQKGNVSILAEYRSTHLLEVTRVKRITNNGKEIDGFMLLQTPVFAIFGHALNQILRCDTHVFSVAYRPTVTDIEMMQHLIGEIGRENSPKTCLYSTLLKRTRQTDLLNPRGEFIDRQKKQRFKLKLKKWFDRWQKMGIIKSFIIGSDKITWEIKDIEKIKKPKYIDKKAYIKAIQSIH